jgi:hypothetical protein
LRAECWDSSDLAHLANVREEIWSLDLHTPAFDDQGLAALPELPNLEIFEHHAAGTLGLSALARFPRLRILRLHLKDTFHVGNDGGHLDALTDLTITNLPSVPWGQSALVDLVPAAASVSLHATGILWLDGPFSPSVRSLSLTATEVAGHPRLPTSLEHLTIRLAHGTDEEVTALLDGVTQVGSLTLRGTPVTNAVIPTVERYGLRHFDLVDTSVTADALARFHAVHPEVSLFPRPHPDRADVSPRPPGRGAARPSRRPDGGLCRPGPSSSPNPPGRPPAAPGPAGP